MKENNCKVNRFIRSKLLEYFRDKDSIDFIVSMSIYKSIYELNNTDSYSFKIRGFHLYKNIIVQLKYIVGEIIVKNEIMSIIDQFSRIESFYEYLKVIFSYLDNYYVKYHLNYEEDKICDKFLQIYFEMNRESQKRYIDLYLKTIIEIKGEGLNDNFDKIKALSRHYRIYRKLISKTSSNYLTDYIDDQYIKLIDKEVKEQFDNGVKISQICKKVYFEVSLCSKMFSYRLSKSVAATIKYKSEKLIKYIEGLIFNYKSFHKTFSLILLMDSNLESRIKEIYEGFVKREISKIDTGAIDLIYSVIERFYKQLKPENFKYFENILILNVQSILGLSNSKELASIHDLIIKKIENEKNILDIDNRSSLKIFKIFYSNELAKKFLFYIQRELLVDGINDVLKYEAINNYITNTLGLDSMLRMSIVSFRNSYCYNSSFSVTLLVEHNWKRFCYDKHFLNEMSIFDFLVRRYNIPNQIIDYVNKQRKTHDNYKIRPNISRVKFQIYNTIIISDTILLFILTSIHNFTFKDISINQNAINYYVKLLTNLKLISYCEVNIYKINKNTCAGANVFNLFNIAAIEEPLIKPEADKCKNPQLNEELILKSQIVKCLKINKKMTISDLNKEVKCNDCTVVINELETKEYIRLSEDRKTIFYN